MHKFIVRIEATFQDNPEHEAEHKVEYEIYLDSITNSPEIKAAESALDTFRKHGHGSTSAFPNNLAITVKVTS